MHKPTSVMDGLGVGQSEDSWFIKRMSRPLLGGKQLPRFEDVTHTCFVSRWICSCCCG